MALFRLTPLPMLIRRAYDGRILAANPAFLGLIGRVEADVVGRALDEIVAIADPAQRVRLDAELSSGQVVERLETSLKMSDGFAHCLLWATTLHAFQQSCVLLIFQDVTERRRDERQLFEAIQAVMRDSDWFSRSVIEKLATIRAPASKPLRSAELDELTKREREVLAMISHGWTDAEIAVRLGLTRSTVRNHVAGLYSKIGVHNRSSAIVWARERALNILFPASVFSGRSQPSASHS